METLLQYQEIIWTFKKMTQETRYIISAEALLPQPADVTLPTKWYAEFEYNAARDGDIQYYLTTPLYKVTPIVEEEVDEDEGILVSEELGAPKILDWPRLKDQVKRVEVTPRITQSELKEPRPSDINYSAPVEGDIHFVIPTERGDLAARIDSIEEQVKLLIKLFGAQ